MKNFHEVYIGIIDQTRNIYDLMSYYMSFVCTYVVILDY